MKIGGPKPPSAPAAPGAVRPSAPAQPLQRPADALTIMGIPETELTPRVRAAIAELMGEVDRLRRELEATKGRLAEAAQLADQDPLTAVLNRRAFVRELSRVLAFSERYGVAACLVFFDLDDFKQVNDEFGHAAGDAALVHLGETLLANVRESDVVGRLGGDEFAVILAKAEREVALKKAESLAAAIRAAPPVVEGRAVPLSFSYGVVAFRNGVSAQEALKEADREMYAQKRARRSPGGT